MQLLTVVSAASLVAFASARSALTENNKPRGEYGQVHIINRCPYNVNLWSVLKGDGCPSDQMLTLKQGETYTENFDLPTNRVGVSIKLSKTDQCKPNDITQFEYFLETTKGDGINGNYMDISYVDCLGNNCPAMKEGYYLVAGDQKSEVNAAANGNTRNPILSCTDRDSCAKISYILPDDPQTKYCSLKQDVYYYMCGGQAPSAGDYQPGSSKPGSSSQAAPTKASSSAANYKVNAAAVTNAPEVKEQPKAPKVKTEVVYVTKYEYVNAKRHAHAHARRHQNFHA